VIAIQTSLVNFSQGTIGVLSDGTINWTGGTLNQAFPSGVTCGPMAGCVSWLV
jgi:hypothetical protein